EDVLLDPGVELHCTVAPDGVDEPPAVRRQTGVDDAAELVIVIGADVLEHADREEDVVFAVHVAIVVLDELDLAVETLALGALAREGDLLSRDVEGADARPIPAGHVESQGAPAAASLDDAITALQRHLAAD